MTSKHSFPRAPRTGLRRTMATLVVLAATATATVVGATIAPAAPTVEGSTTGGSGGGPADTTFASYTSPSTGHTGEYHVFAEGLDTGRPVGMMLQFHGDGAFEFENPDSPYSLGGREGLRAQAQRHNMVLVAMKAPGSVWYRDGAENADYVRDLVEQEVYGRFDVDRERAWLVGYSGGAQFVTQFLLPQHSALFDGGGAVVFGGGGQPPGGAEPFAPGLVSDLALHWYTGAEDDGSCGSGFDALGATERGASFYRSEGFAVTVERPSGVCHNLSGRFGPVTGEILDARYGTVRAS